MILINAIVCLLISLVELLLGNYAAAALAIVAGLGWLGWHLEEKGKWEEA